MAIDGSGSASGLPTQIISLRFVSSSIINLTPKNRVRHARQSQSHSHSARFWADTSKVRIQAKVILDAFFNETLTTP